MRLTYLPILAAICLCPAFAGAAPVVPGCAGPITVAGAQVTGVGRNGTLILEHNRAAVLEGIRLPAGYRDQAPLFLANEAVAALNGLVRGAPVAFAATPPEKDRYDRLRAQVFGRVWLQRAMLERGLARVSIAPDRSECAADLYEAEAAARKAGRGLWALPAYRVRGADMALRDEAGTFQIVEGKVVNAGSGNGRTFLDFSEDWRHGFSAIVVGDDRKTFRRNGFDLSALAGCRIRLRGIVEVSAGRPEIALSNPAQIEILE